MFITSSTTMESEIKLWLTEILQENIDEYSVKVLGNSEKGDGYIGDIVFVSLLAENPEKQQYNLVLKCSKRSPALREKWPIKQLFLQEILMYETVLPEFVKFQKETGLADVFNKIPKFYGSFIDKNMEVMALENLKTKGFDLWGKKEPFTKKHIEMILSEYAKLHGTSIAMQQQQPDQFQALVGCFDANPVIQFGKALYAVFLCVIDEIRAALKGDLDEKLLEKWTSFKDHIDNIFYQFNDTEGVQVISHGDCWIKNFLFTHDISNENHPLDVAILDWQFARYFSPAVDVSYLLFSGISKEDINQMDHFLEFYYEKMKMYTGKLGSDLEQLYTFGQFMKDWSKYSKFAILMSCLTLKICAISKQEVSDLTELDEKYSFNTRGELNYETNKNKDALRERFRHFVKYVVEKGLI